MPDTASAGTGGGGHRLPLLALEHAEAHREDEHRDDDEQHDHVHGPLELAPGPAGRHRLRDGVEVVVRLVILPATGEAPADEGPCQHVGVDLRLVRPHVHAQGGAVGCHVAERARLAEEEPDQAPVHALGLLTLHEAVLHSDEPEHAAHELAARDVNVRVGGGCRGDGAADVRCEKQREQRRPAHLWPRTAASYIRAGVSRGIPWCGQRVTESVTTYSSDSPELPTSLRPCVRATRRLCM